MAYTYVEKEIRHDLYEICMNVISKLRINLIEYFTFDCDLIGSGSFKMLTKNGNDNHIDLDFNLVIQKDKKELLDDPQMVRKLFFDNLKLAMKDNKIFKAHNSKSVITIYYGKYKGFQFSFDIAIYKKENNQFYKLILQKEKSASNYIWNLTRNLYTFKKYVKFIKKHKRWTDVRILYLKKKDSFKGDHTQSSFSILSQTVNEVYMLCKK